MPVMDGFQATEKIFDYQMQYVKQCDDSLGSDDGLLQDRALLPE